MKMFYSQFIYLCVCVCVCVCELGYRVSKGQDYMNINGRMDIQYLLALKTVIGEHD